MSEDRRMPVIFAGHGTPLNAKGDNRANASWKLLGRKIPKPDAVLAVSSHWQTLGTFVRTLDDNRKINDMYGYPQDLSDLEYAPKGSPALAKEVLQLLGDSAQAGNTWGMDSAIWSVLYNMYPDADVPVVMMSTDVDAAPDALYALGSRLRPLRSENVLILASGNVVHNLVKNDYYTEGAFDWAQRFDDNIRKAVEAGDSNKVMQYAKDPDSALAVPSTDHFNPLLIAMGAAFPDNKVTVFNNYCEYRATSMTSYIWGEFQ